MRCAVEGIMYPINAKAVLSSALSPVSGHHYDLPYIEIPHKAWSLCMDDLDSRLLPLSGDCFPFVFVLAPLHKGPVTFEGPCPVYAPEDGSLSGSDWSITLECPDAVRSMVSFSDDICSEESSLEIIAPYLSLLFPQARTCYLLSSGDSPEILEIVKILRKDFPSSLILLSNNRDTDYAHAWKEALDR
ncbi:MAG: hypothetical protein ILP16_10950 [Spirochaetales bacterium]|nr:hypothetical protein [Spirochaetales bacterium]